MINGGIKRIQDHHYLSTILASNNAMCSTSHWWRHHTCTPVLPLMMCINCYLPSLALFASALSDAYTTVGNQAMMMAMCQVTQVIMLSPEEAIDMECTKPCKQLRLWLAAAVGQYAKSVLGTAPATTAAAAEQSAESSHARQCGTNQVDCLQKGEQLTLARAAAMLCSMLSPSKGSGCPSPSWLCCWGLHTKV